MRNRGFIVRTIYAACLAGATINHVRAVLTHGWLPAHLPWPSATYWSSLTILEPMAAVLLFIRPRIGVAATIAIIVSDVAHNIWFVASHPLGGSAITAIGEDPFVLSQIGFLLFVGLTARAAMDLPQRRSRSPSRLHTNAG